MSIIIIIVKESTIRNEGVAASSFGREGVFSQAYFLSPMLEGEGSIPDWGGEFSPGVIPIFRQIVGGFSPGTPVCQPPLPPPLSLFYVKVHSSALSKVSFIQLQKYKYTSVQ